MKMYDEVHIEVFLSKNGPQLAERHYRYGPTEPSLLETTKKEIETPCDSARLVTHIHNMSSVA